MSEQESQRLHWVTKDGDGRLRVACGEEFSLQSLDLDEVTCEKCLEIATKKAQSKQKATAGKMLVIDESGQKGTNVSDGHTEVANFNSLYQPKVEVPEIAADNRTLPNRESNWAPILDLIEQKITETKNQLEKAQFSVDCYEAVKDVYTRHNRFPCTEPDREGVILFQKELAKWEGCKRLIEGARTVCGEMPNLFAIAPMSFAEWGKVDANTLKEMSETLRLAKRAMSTELNAAEAREMLITIGGIASLTSMPAPTKEDAEKLETEGADRINQIVREGLQRVHREMVSNEIEEAVANVEKMEGIRQRLSICKGCGKRRLLTDRGYCSNCPSLREKTVRRDS